MTRYLVSREALVGLVLVMDIRHPLTDGDWQLIELQQRGASQLHVLLTKADKLSRNQANRSVVEVQKALEEAGIEATLQVFSSLKATGVEDAHAVLDHWLFEIPLP